MLINIRRDLERPTRRGRTSVYHHIICRKEEADKEANDYIWNTIHNPNLIRTVKFDVSYRDAKGRLVKHFQYSPTYPAK